MGRQVAGVFYAVVMAAVIVGGDVAFFRNRFCERLMVNIGIVLVFGAFYLRFFRLSRQPRNRPVPTHQRPRCRIPREPCGSMHSPCRHA